MTAVDRISYTQYFSNPSNSILHDYLYMYLYSLTNYLVNPSYIISLPTADRQQWSLSVPPSSLSLSLSTTPSLSSSLSILLHPLFSFLLLLLVISLLYYPVCSSSGCLCESPLCSTSTLLLIPPPLYSPPLFLCFLTYPPRLTHTTPS